MHGTIVPHGGTLINRIVDGARVEALRVEADAMQSITLSSKQSCDLEMIGIGAYSPLAGFMGQQDFSRVCAEMRLADGTVWPIPILLAVEKDRVPAIGSRLALRAPNGTVQGILTVEEAFAHDKALEIPSVFGTEDPDHPGVKQVMDEGAVCLAGPVDVLTDCVDPDGPEAFLEHRLTPAQTRAAFERNGWTTVAAFQTRNPIHRAHEYLCKCAQEITDGLLIHPLVGQTKPSDIPAEVRMACYRVLIEQYFHPERTMLSVLPAAMRYAGPREALLHALIRKNYGVTHFIVGRDHAGVGDYYGTYDAQRIFDRFSKDELGIEPLKFEHAAWSHRARGMVSDKTFPILKGDRVFLSGTELRAMLRVGRRPPEEFTRPEVADVLIAWAAQRD